MGVVVLPDVRGLHPYYVALAERFAETGAGRRRDRLVRPDGGRLRRPGHPGRGLRLAGRTSRRPRPTGIDADITAAIGYLRERTGADLPVVTVGFCFGGSHSWRQSGGDLDLAGCAGFYGKPSVVGRRGRTGRTCPR